MTHGSPAVPAMTASTAFCSTAMLSWAANTSCKPSATARSSPANDVRALAGVMHDKRANHAVFVTPSWFSDDGRRFAADNRIRLIEGSELEQLLHEYLNLEVLVPKRGAPPRR